MHGHAIGAHLRPWVPGVAIALGFVAAAAGVAHVHGVWAGAATGGVGVVVVVAYLAAFGSLAGPLVGAHAYGGDPGSASGSTIHGARLYDVLVTVLTFGREGRLRQQILDVADLCAGARVLDVCCGTGTLAVAAADRVGSAGTVVGIDASPEMIARARSKGAGVAQVRFEVASADALPLPDGAFDVAFCTLGIHHLPAASRDRAIVELHRVLAPGGRLVIVEFAEGGGGSAPVAHASVGVVDAVEAAMRRLGLDDVARGPVGPRGLVFVRGRRGGA